MSRLQEEIEKYIAAFKEKVPQEIQETMLNATQELKNITISKNAKQVGDTLENLPLININGNQVKLYDFYNNSDFLVINFYRGLWCPYCNLELNALQSILDELKSYNASLVAISPQTPDKSLTTKEKNDLKFEVLSDIDNKVAKQYGLVFSLAEELRPIYDSFGIDINGSNGNDTYEIPMPATYILDKNGKILFSYIDEDYTKRIEPQEILDIIKKNK